MEKRRAGTRSGGGGGIPANTPELDGEALATLRERVGELTPSPRAASIEEVELPAAEPLPPAVVEAAGAENVFTSAEDRVRHATGRGYADLARLRSGRLEAAPDAVVLARRRRAASPGSSMPAPPRASRSSPSAAGPASSAASSRCAARTSA